MKRTVSRQRIMAALIDIDGTLVDSNESHVAAWRQAFLDCGRDIPAASVRGQIGKGADMLIPALLPDADRELRARLATRQGEIFKQHHLPHVHPFRGAAQCVRELAGAGLRTVLASSASEEEVAHYVALLDLSQVLTATTSADDVAHSKPAGDIVAEALRKVAPVSPSQAVLIGDTPYDAIAAASCGVPMLAVRSGGFSDETLRKAGAHAIFDDIGAVLAALRGAAFHLPA